MEATWPGVTSVVVPRKDERALADAIFALYSDAEKRKELGMRGRQFVLDNYEYRLCFKKIEQLFQTIKA